MLAVGRPLVDMIVDAATRKPAAGILAIRAPDEVWVSTTAILTLGLEKRGRKGFR